MFVRLHAPTPAVERGLPKAVIWRTYHRQVKLHIAHRFLILPFLVSWSGWLAWRWRRITRAEP